MLPPNSTLDQERIQINRPFQLLQGETSKFNGQLCTIHQLDCIYFGEINKSYQKEGFGILQTVQFQTYFGFWKNGNAEGQGVVIYPTGQIIYGNFNRNQLSGAALIDDGKLMRIGIFEGLQIIGIGYEYDYQHGRWKMIKYNRGMPISQIKDQQMNLSEGIPAMLRVQHSIYSLLDNYMNYRWFTNEQITPKNKKNKQKKQNSKESQAQTKYANLNNLIIGENINNMTTIGFKDEIGLYGLCCIYNQNEKRLIETGFYQGNNLQGYGYTSQAAGHKLLGPYINGNKHGIFIEQDLLKTIGIQYRDNCYITQIKISLDQIKKKQKVYNYEQKNFLSAKNNLEFNHLFKIFSPAEVQHFANKNTTQIKLNSSLNKNSHGLQSESQSSNSLLKNILKTNRKKQSLQKRNPSQTNNNKTNSIKEERSSIAIMLQKMKNYQLFGNQIRRNSPVRSQKVKFEDQEEEIAIQQNPFDNKMLGKNRIT